MANSADPDQLASSEYNAVLNTDVWWAENSIKNWHSVKFYRHTQVIIRKWKLTFGEILSTFTQVIVWKQI